MMSKHYKGKFECKDVMVETFGKDAFRQFCHLNAFKYIWRAGKKDSYTQDISKAREYLDYILAMSEDKDV